MAGALIAPRTRQQGQGPIAGVAVPFRLLPLLRHQPQSCISLQGPPTDPPLEPGEKGAAVEAPSGAGSSAPHPSSCPSSFFFAEPAAPQPPRWPHGEVSFLPDSGCMLRAEKAVETRGGPIIATRLLLRPDTLRHDAGSQREANHDGQGHPQFCRRLQHSGTVGMPCMKTWMAVTLRSAMTLFHAAVVVLVRLKGY
jgi:hypothetical protein